jgi:UDP-GlcNAc:undecaprenyl-phosphate GlcNAc-1-phosphate transferase
MNIFSFLNYLLLSSIISFFLYFPTKKIAEKFNLLDHPSERKIHKKPLPRIGGVMIFSAFILTIFFVFRNEAFKLIRPKLYNDVLILVLASFSFLLGLADDIKNIPAIKKLTIQFLIGFMIAFSGLSIEKITIMNSVISFGWLSYPITALWVVAIMNAVNLIDGLDGLASGIMIIALSFTFVISIIEANYFVAIISIVLTGSILGFYIFNFPPAKMFMGDGGSYFIGVMYAMISMMGMKKTSMAIMFAIPFVLLLIPVADVIYTSVRRAKRKTGVFHADKNHIHHRLMGIGFSVKQINFLVYLVCISFGLIALLITLTGGKFGLIFFFLVLCLTIAGFGVIRIMEKKK